MYIVPLNYVSADQIGELPDTSEPEPDDDERTSLEDLLLDVRVIPDADKEQRALRSATSRHRTMRAHIRLIERALSRIVSRESKALERIIRAAFQTAEPVAELAKQLRAFYETLPEAIQRELLPVFRALAELISGEVVQEVGGEIEPENPQMRGEVAAYVEQFSTRYTQGSLGQLESIISTTEPELIEEALTERVSEWVEKKAAKTARREAVRSTGAFSKFAYTLVGVIVLRWLAIGKSCPLCNELNGRTVGVEQFFLAKGETLEAEGANPLTTRHSISHPPIHDGCDCMIVAG
jgi:hypothetical protein